jgi:hypothetical protein
MRGKRFGEVRAKRRENFPERQQNQTQQRHRNGWGNAKMGRLAKPAIRLIVASRVRVRHNLQQEEKRNQRQRKRGTRGQPAISPAVR